MSASLLDLIKAYGDARASWAANGVPNYVPEALALVEERIGQMRGVLVAFDYDDPDRESQIFTLMKLLDRGTA